MSKQIKKALAAALTAAMVISGTAVTAFAAEGGTVTSTVEGIEHTFNITEATAVQKYVAKISTFTEYEQRFYDVNNDGVVNISDATLIQQFIAHIKDTPKFYETSGYTVIEYPAEYEEVYHEAVTEEVPTYVYDSRCICTVCGEDITDLLFRMDNAVANGEIIPGDGNYEKLTQIDGHCYDFTNGEIEDEYGLAIPADDSEHDKKDIAEYGRDYWSYYAGWTSISHWLYYGTSTYVSEEDYGNDIGYFTGEYAGDYAIERTDLRLVWEPYSNLALSPTPIPEVLATEEPLNYYVEEVIYKTVEVEAAYTEKVLVKEAYTEKIFVEAGWH